MEFREWLAEELNRRGFSHRQFAKQAGLSSSLVNKVATGRMPASADFCIAVGTTLGLNPVPLLRLAGHLPPEPPGGDAVDSADLDSLAAIVRNLSPEKRKQLWDFARFLNQ